MGSISKLSVHSVEQFIPLPIPIPAPQKHLSDQQLSLILNRIGAAAFTNLNYSQQQQLFALIPPEQETSSQTPNVNLLIREKQKRDLIAICNHSAYKLLIFEKILPQPSDVRNMPPKKVSQILTKLTDHVSTMIHLVQENPCNESPEILLRNPKFMADLLPLYDILQPLNYDAYILLYHKDPLIDALLTHAEEQLMAINILEDAAILTGTALSTTAEEHYKKAIELQKFYSSFPGPKIFKDSCADTINALILLEREREALVKNIIKAMDLLIDFLEPNLLFDENQPDLDEVFECPMLGEEKDWIYKVSKHYLFFLPYISLHKATQRFLTPYLEGKITSATENLSRGDLKNSILPKFRASFPETELTDEDIERFILSVYLKLGAKELNLQNLLQTQKTMEEIASSGSTPHKNKSNEIILDIFLHTFRFSTALEHSLRIDFKSMNLTDVEIKWLANETLFNPTTPITSDWRVLAAPQQ